MTHAESHARNQAMLADAETMTQAQIAVKYGFNHQSYVSLILRRLRKGLPSRREYLQRRNEAILKDAPYMSAAELVTKHRTSLNTVRSILSHANVRIGIRANIRRGISPDNPNAFKQLKVVAALKANPSHTFSEVGLSFHVSREMVSQIAFKARELGLLDKVPLRDQP